MRYITIRPDSISTVFSATKRTEINSIESLHLIASTYFVDRTLIISYDDLFYNIGVLNLKRITIYHIQEQIGNECKSFNDEFIGVYYVSYEHFANFISSSDFNFDFNNRYCLFIFYGLSWGEIVLKFKQDLDITVSGGSNVKRHLLSPVQARLTSYMIALFNLNCLEVFRHNRFNILDKNQYLPYFDFSNKSNINFTKEGIKTTVPHDSDKYFTQDKHTNIKKYITIPNDNIAKTRFHTKSITIANHNIGRKTRFHTKTNSLSNPTIKFLNNNTLYISKKVIRFSLYKTKHFINLDS